MKTNTFILIVAGYSLLLGFPAVFAPAMALEYFNGTPNNPNELSSMNYIGGYQLAIGFLGFVVRKSNDKISQRGWLFATAFLTLYAIIVLIININLRGMIAQKTIILDISIWAVIALGALHFWNKEKPQV
ncbi:hypothetical protein GCM10011514_22410 [Emticicia aquatilis]|uniref:DUF4345 domain-containing protein n=1 Tax=Emticicia aquatilis TaxID=1537369 RepID=A0A917DPL0_9BACT|nr:hypothetical protein [Emticicia aquatilis]GGD57827.1 hypothetical protein GCM10011514_22410 [Emticicia aquatilis]